MGNRRVALLCAQQLLGESLENVLVRAEEIVLLGPWGLDEGTLARLSDQKPDIVLIAESECTPEDVSRMTARILEQFPELPIIRVTLENNLLRIYSSQILPARSSDLIDLIRKAPIARHVDGSQAEPRGGNEA